MRESKYAFFDLLKFVSAICIACFLHYYEHFLGTLGVDTPLNNNFIFHFLFKFSYVLTDLFFVMSGILFAYCYHIKITKGLGIDSFMKGRYKRVMPLVAVTSVLTFLGNLVLFISGDKLFSQGSVSLWDLICDVLFSGKAIMGGGVILNAPIWYINVLLLCYFVAFICVTVENKINFGFVYIIPVILGIMMQCTGGNYPMWNPLIARGFIAFFVGVLLNRYLEVMPSKKMSIARILSLVIMLVALAVVVSPYKDSMIGEFTSYADFLIFTPMIILLYDCSWINKLCSNKLIKYSGDISFGIYLFNFPILILCYILVKNQIVSVDITSIWFVLILTAVHIIVAAVYNVILKAISKDK